MMEEKLVEHMTRMKTIWYVRVREGGRDRKRFINIHMLSWCYVFVKPNPLGQNGVPPHSFSKQEYADRCIILALSYRKV